MDCPQCGLVNRETALVCDCGYDFNNGSNSDVKSEKKGGNKGMNTLIVTLSVVLLVFKLIRLISSF